MTKKFVVVALCCSALGACAELNSIQATFDASTDKVATIDAKQRVISINPDGRGGIDVCVEQSPDAFSVFSGSAALSAEAQAEFAASLALAVAESGASLAFRTQVTQAQSNLLYTLCQLHSNGALTEQAVRAELRRFQHTVIGLLAIEQLTSPYRQTASQQILTTASASAGLEVDARQQEVTENQKVLDAKKEELQTAQKTVTDAGANATDAQKQAVLTKQGEVDQAEGNLVIAREKLRAARLAVQAAANGQVGVINVYPPPSSGAVSDAAARAVVESLDIVLTRGVLVDSCVEAVLERRSATNTLANDPSTARIDAECEKVFAAYIGVYMSNETAQSDAIRAQSEFARQVGLAALELAKQGKLTADQLKTIVGLVNSPGSSPTTPSPYTGPGVLQTDLLLPAY